MLHTNGPLPLFSQKIAKDLDLKLDDGSRDRRFFRQGHKAEGGPSVFSDVNLGRKQVYQAPKFIARRLNKRHWQEYASFSMKTESGSSD